MGPQRRFLANPPGPENTRQPKNSARARNRTLPRPCFVTPYSSGRSDLGYLRRTSATSTSGARYSSGRSECGYSSFTRTSSTPKNCDIHSNLTPRSSYDPSSSTHPFADFPSISPAARSAAPNLACQAEFLLYLGESENSCTATPEFFQALTDRYFLVRTVPIPRFAVQADQLWI